MIKNITIFLLLLSIGVMYWLGFPDEQPPGCSKAAVLKGHAAKGFHKIGAHLASSPEGLESEKGPNGTSFATPNGTRYCALVFSF